MLSYVQFYVAMTVDVQTQQCSSVAFIEFESMAYDFISDKNTAYQIILWFTLNIIYSI